MTPSKNRPKRKPKKKKPAKLKVYLDKCAVIDIAGNFNFDDKKGHQLDRKVRLGLESAAHFYDESAYTLTQMGALEKLLAKRRKGVLKFRDTSEKFKDWKKPKLKARIKSNIYNFKKNYGYKKPLNGFSGEDKNEYEQALRADSDIFLTTEKALPNYIREHPFDFGEELGVEILTPAELLDRL